MRAGTREVDGFGFAVKIDRLGVVVNGSEGQRPPTIEKFVVVRNIWVPQQGPIRTYLRSQEMRAEDGTRIFWQYVRQHKFLAKSRAMFVGNDRSGLALGTIDHVLHACPDYRITLLEIALDFNRAAGMDRKRVLRNGVFGKSRLRRDLGGEEQLRYGSRSSDLMVRAYFKEQVNRFRIELEFHSRMLRRNAIDKLCAIPAVSAIIPKHFRLVRMDWERLGKYLQQRSGAMELCIFARAKSMEASRHVRMTHAITT